MRSIQTTSTASLIPNLVLLHIESQRKICLRHFRRLMKANGEPLLLMYRMLTLTKRLMRRWSPGDLSTMSQWKTIKINESTFISVSSLYSIVNLDYGLVQLTISTYRHLQSSIYLKCSNNKAHRLLHLPQDQMMRAGEEQQLWLLNRMQRGGRRSTMMHRLAFVRIKGDNRRLKENTSDNNSYRLNRDLERLSRPLSRTRDGDFVRCNLRY